MSVSEQFLYHRGPITCAAQVGNSQQIITSGYDSAVALFDIDTEQVELLGYHEHLVNRVTVNHDGTLAASASSDYNIYLWDLVDKSLKRVLKGHDDDVEDFVFINDHLGASVSRDWRILVWNLDTGAIERIILGHEKDVLSINYFAGKLYTSGDDMTLRVWDIDTGKQLAKIGPFTTETDSCAIDEKNHRLILGCDDGIVRVFDLQTHQLIAQLEGHTSAIKKVAVSPTNGNILSAAYDQRILIWDHQNFAQIQQLESKNALWERSFNWASDGLRVIAGSFDGTVFVWDVTSGACIHHLGHKHAMGNACFNDVASKGDGTLVAVSDDGIIRVGLLTIEQARWRTQYSPQNGRVLMNAVHFCSQMQKVIAGAHNQHLYLFERSHQNLHEQASIALDEGPINSIVSAHHSGYQGDLFVACYSGKIAHLASDGRQIKKISAHDNAVKALALHPHQRLGISCCAEGELVSWDFEGNIQQHYLGHTAIIDDVAIDPSGRYVASAGRDFILKVHGIEDGKLHHCIHLGKRSPKGLLFLDQSTVIITNYWGELLKVDLTDGSVVRNSIAKNGISAVVRHGEFLAATSYDGAIYLVDPKQLITVNSLRSMTQKTSEPAYV
ncbi:WD40 repeat domain-containing protein [Pseudoalteromonas sp. T1lg23B]|uniref:WD40 repeat domain-containing protein n=1 Tax=Pseudoalteromonas sp. T1lg23B TaxID=2077097 RepID=UPI000CF5DC32|nr:WD40 repeat domain-containing protein [Pseudoalteromonas sp. T1lg23B]